MEHTYTLVKEKLNFINKQMGDYGTAAHYESLPFFMLEARQVKRVLTNLKNSYEEYNPDGSDTDKFVKFTKCLAIAQHTIEDLRKKRIFDDACLLRHEYIQKKVRENKEALQKKIDKKKSHVEPDAKNITDFNLVVDNIMSKRVMEYRRIEEKEADRLKSEFSTRKFSSEKLQEAKKDPWTAEIYKKYLQENDFEAPDPPEPSECSEDEDDEEDEESEDSDEDEKAKKKIEAHSKDSTDSKKRKRGDEDLPPCKSARTIEASEASPGLEQSSRVLDNVTAQ